MQEANCAAPSARPVIDNVIARTQEQKCEETWHPEWPYADENVRNRPDVVVLNCSALHRSVSVQNLDGCVFDH